ncbi:MAG: hypothetical protein ACXVBZ_12215, partial [Flavisolibacter sp.]
MTRSLITLAAIAQVALFIPGCEKGNDYVVHPGSPELKNCPILRIIRNRSGTIDTLVFSYNSWGDPLSVTKLPHTNTGSPNYTFKYDKKHRLTEIIGMYD